MPEYSEAMKKYFSSLLCVILSSCVYHDIAPQNPPVKYVCGPSVSWENDILPIMVSACATSGCHDGISRRDWTNYNEVKLYTESIKIRTVNRSMPFDGEPLPQDQIDMIACWVDNGAMEN